MQVGRGRGQEQLVAGRGFQLPGQHLGGVDGVLDLPAEAAHGGWVEGLALLEQELLRLAGAVPAGGPVRMGLQSLSRFLCKSGSGI